MVPTNKDVFQSTENLDWLKKPQPNNQKYFCWIRIRTWFEREYLERERKTLFLVTENFHQYSDPSRHFSFIFIMSVILDYARNLDPLRNVLWLSLLPTSLPSPGKALVNVEVFNKWVDPYALCLPSPRACSYRNVVSFTACGGRGDILHGLIIKKKTPVLTKVYCIDTVNNLM